MSVLKLIPSCSLSTNSNAELVVFNKLKESFVCSGDSFALHSLNLTKHKRKQFAEADFVIVCEFGLFVIEVKGGRISVDENRTWYTKDRNDNEFILKESPFVQAEGALHAIRKYLNKSGKLNHVRIPDGIGVVTPNTEWVPQSVEWDKQTICDCNHFRNFDDWLVRFFAYWREKPNNDGKLNKDNIRLIKQLLRPRFELVEPLFSKLSTIGDDSVSLTVDQYNCLDLIEANSRSLCYGGAGTGKTFLAAELFRRLANSGRTIGFICKSNWLKRYLEKRIEDETQFISTIDSVKLDMKRSGVSKFDYLIIDEGQDLFNEKDFYKLEEILVGGLDSGKWCIFHDVNNQSGLLGDTDSDVYRKLLQSSNNFNCPLKTNCRNTSDIIDKINNLLKLDMGTGGISNGPIVEEHFCNGDGTILEEVLSKLKTERVPGRSISILSPMCYNESSVAKMPDRIIKTIIELDDYSVREFPIPDISFAEIKNFKGLENDVVIVVDLPDPRKLNYDFDKTNHYVAMSRAKGLLIVVWNDKIR
jgi:hypothetical protein